MKYRKIDVRQLEDGYVVIVNGHPIRRDYKIVQWLDHKEYVVEEPSDEPEDYDP